MKKLALIIIGIICLIKPSLYADQLKLDTLLGQPVMEADKKQTAYLQVSLTGFKLDCQKDRAPVNIAIIIDKSGSMGGEKIEKAKQAAIMAIQRLNSNDILSVVTYDSTVNVLIPATKVSDKQTICSLIRNIKADGSTALYDGVTKGACELKKFIEQNRINRMILLSDGLANVGIQSPTELGKLGEELIKDGISVTTIGIGLGYNEDLMTQLAYKSDGSHYFAEKACDLTEVFDTEFGQALSMVAQDINIKVTCPSYIRPVRLLGRQGSIDGQCVTVLINQLHSQHEKFIILEVEVPAAAEEIKRKLATVNVTYENLKTNKTESLNSEIFVEFSNSKSTIEKRTNPTVMANVVELIATKQNELALELRDKGNIKEARQVLSSNFAYLNDNSIRYDSKKLKEYGKQQQADMDNMDEENWTRQRKLMRQYQFSNNSQQTAK